MVSLQRLYVNPNGIITVLRTEGANKNPKGGEVRLLPNFEHTSIPMMMEENKWCDFYYIISWDDYDMEMFVTIFESRYDEKLETQYWHETASMRHSEMLRAYAEAS